LWLVFFLLLDLTRQSVLIPPNDFDDPTSEEQLDPSCVCFCLSGNDISAVQQSEFGGKLVQDLLLRNQFDNVDDSSANLLSLQAKLFY
jgi:hypothetical protein